GVRVHFSQKYSDPLSIWHRGLLPPDVLEQNPQMVPANLGLADAMADLDGIEQLRPRLVRLARLSERAFDTNFALGSDVMAAALEGYNLLKRSGTFPSNTG